MITDKITAVDVFGKEHQVEIKGLTWRPSVYGIVIEDGKLLMSKQFKTKFDVPGGGVDIGEDLEQAVVREVKEETGIDVEVVRLAGVKSNIFIDTHSKGIHYGESYHSILLFYLCRKVGGELSTDGFGKYEKHYAEIAEWVPMDRLDSIDVACSIEFRDIIKEVFNGS